MYTDVLQGFLVSLKCGNTQKNPTGLSGKLLEKYNPYEIFVFFSYLAGKWLTGLCRRVVPKMNNFWIPTDLFLDGSVSVLLPP